MQLEMSIMETIVLFPLWTNWLDNSTGERKVCNQNERLRILPIVTQVNAYIEFLDVQLSIQILLEMIA